MAKHYWVNDDEGMQVLGPVSDPSQLQYLVEYAWQAGKDGQSLDDINVGISEFTKAELEAMPEV